MSESVLVDDEDGEFESDDGSDLFDELAKSIIENDAKSSEKIVTENTNPLSPIQSKILESWKDYP